ncbi:MotA/TolQ/ExbB proton channel family protein [Gaetbulibacter aestuarii]|uniref:MotA/TolQ/ExbB proton channel family protein n=1 Tax=Gaetbulibacter aestuarii TaxID=1502358 RepID=A0ABW7N1Z3_9FLAO
MYSFILTFIRIPLIGNPFVERFYEGNPVFMTPILLCFLISIGFIVFGFLKLKTNSALVNKMLKLTADSSLLGLVFGFLGSVIGLIGAFDGVEAIGNPSPALFAGGLKVSLLAATFGLVTFLFARLGILILRGLKKVEDDNE